MKKWQKIIIAILGTLICGLAAVDVLSQDTDANLTTQANVIRNETVAGANTKTRIADMYQALIDSKVSILAPRLTTSSTNGYVWTANGTTGLGQWSAAASSGIVVGTTTITSGTNTRILYNNSGVVGEYPIGTGVATALSVNVGSAGSFVVNGGALGTPSSGDFSSGTFTWPTFNQNTTGSAATLTTPRNIQGVSFNGSASIDIINGTGFVKATGTTLSYDNATYLTTSSAASTYQPLDADLTSWAAITRASGIDTWITTPSYTNLKSALTGTSPWWDLGTTSQTLTGNLAFTGSSSNQLAFNFTSLGANSGVIVNSTATDAASNTQRAFSALQSGANGTSSQTTAAGYFSNTKTGTTSTNYAIHAVSSGGTTNRSIYADGTIEVTGSSLVNLTSAGDIQFPNGQSAAIDFTDGTDNILRINTTDNRVEWGTGYSFYTGASNGTSGQPLLSGGTSNPTWGTLGVAGGGTGAATLTGILQGNGTSAVTVITNSTTVGQILRVTGSNTYAWGAADLADTDAITGILPSANGGTGVSNATQTYTPTLTNSANIDASTPRQCTYFRVGNAITVSGQIDLDPTTTLTLTTLGISLPVASALTTAFQLGGSGASISVSDNAVGIQADATNDRATLQYVCIDTTNHIITFQFTYQVL